MTTATLVLGLLLSAVLLLSGCIQSVNLPSGVEAGPNYTMTIQIACPNLTDTRGTLAIRIPTGWTVKSATYTGAVSGTIHKSNNIISYFSTTWEALPPDSSHNGHKPGYSWWAGYTNPETPGGGATATVTIVVDTHDVSGSFFLLDFITGITDKTAPEDPAQNAGGANWQSGTGAGLDPPGFRLDQPVTLLPASIPSVISSDPAEGASGVPVSKAATVTFSEAMDQANITTANLQIFSSGSSTPLPATVSYNAASHVATIDPTNPLAYSAQYMVRVDSGVTDLVGHTMAGNLLGSLHHRRPNGCEPHGPHSGAGRRRSVGRHQRDRHLRPGHGRRHHHRLLLQPEEGGLGDGRTGLGELQLSLQDRHVGPDRRPGGRRPI